MKQQIKTTEAIFPMPVLLISTFNEDGTVDVMNAAWGTMVSRTIVALNCTETHKTVQNIKIIIPQTMLGSVPIRFSHYLLLSSLSIKSCETSDSFCSRFHISVG